MGVFLSLLSSWLIVSIRWFALLAAGDGQVVLARVDVDPNQRLAMAFQVQGIPAVKAFAGGQLVDEFVGAQPAAVVERFVEALLPSEADLAALF